MSMVFQQRKILFRVDDTTDNPRMSNDELSLANVRDGRVRPYQESRSAVDCDEAPQFHESRILGQDTGYYDTSNTVPPRNSTTTRSEPRHFSRSTATTNV
jgi:hypothetical protein